MRLQRVRVRSGRMPWRGAWVLIGGLTSSMILTMIIVPVVYRIVDGIEERYLKWRGEKKGMKVEFGVQG